MKGSVIIAATLLVTGTGWVPSAFAQSERWMKPEQPVPSPAVAESGIHNEAAEPMGFPQGHKTLYEEEFRRDGVTSATGKTGNEDTERSRESSTSR